MPPPRPSGLHASGRPGRPPQRKRLQRDRPLTLTAGWAGLASALVACVFAIAAVAVLWLPASGGSGSADSAIRAGVLTFLAGVHGGVTVDGVSSEFVPLGLTILTMIIVWRAASAVAGATREQGEDRPSMLLRLVGVQSVVFGVVCALLAAVSTLGTSSAAVVGGFVAGVVLTALVAGSAMLRHSTLGEDAALIVPRWTLPALRATLAATAVYVGAGALLVAGSLVVHHERVAALSHQVGGGWSSVPVLVLGILAAPNAAVAGAGVLSGAGITVGSGTTVGLTGVTTGLVPAFPILGALPTSGGSVVAWLLAAATPLVAGASVAVLVGRLDTSLDRWRAAGASVVFTAVAGVALAWQGGGGIGEGKLRVVGVSPWQFGGWTALWTGLAAAALLGVRAGVEAVRAEDGRPSLRETLVALTSVEHYDGSESEDDEPDGCDESTDSDAIDNDGGDPSDADAATDVSPSADTVPLRDRPDGRDHLAG